MEKDYLKEDLSNEERAELISIIWRVAKKYKLKMYVEQKQTVCIIEDIDLPIVDKYSFDDFDIQSCVTSLVPLTESQKTDIVNKLNMLMDELWLFDLKRALTFNEKLVFFLLSVERYKGVD